MFVKIKDKGRMNVEVTGNGEALVFLHSYLWDKDMWKEQIEELSKEYTCINIELWGHGDSDSIHTTGTYTLEALTEDIIAVVDELEIDKFTFIGLSVGGMVACHLGVKHSQRLDKLVVMDSFIGPEPEATKGLYFNLLGTIEKLGFIPEELAKQIAPMFFSKKESMDKGQLYKEFRKKLMDIPGKNIKTIVSLGRGIFGRESLMMELKDIKVPTLFILGEEDVPRPLAESEEMAKLVENSVLVPIKHAGHISTAENPADVNDALLKFLKL